jgi:hypothetical protein
VNSISLHVVHLSLVLMLSPQYIIVSVVTQVWLNSQRKRKSEWNQRLNGRRLQKFKPSEPSLYVATPQTYGKSGPRLLTHHVTVVVDQSVSTLSIMKIAPFVGSGASAAKFWVEVDVAEIWTSLRATGVASARFMDVCVCCSVVVMVRDGRV